VTDVKVVFSADDQATEVARRLLEVLRGLQREQRTTAQGASALAGPTQRAAQGFERMRGAIAGLRNTSGIDAISRRVALLAEGLRSASTRAQSLARLTAAESQLQRALRQTNLSLEERIRLERQLRQTQSAIAGGGIPGAAGLSGVVSGFQRLQGALGAIGVTLSALSFGRFVKDAIDAADAMSELAQRTGVSTESLSVLSSVAEQSGASTDTLAVGFRNLSRQVIELQQGNREAVETFRALGLTAADIEGLSLDQIFVRIATAMARFEDGAGKSTLATRLFGRAGDELIPTLDQLANGGFDRAREELERLGGIIGGDAAEKANKFNDELVKLRRASQGLALTVGTSLIPQMTELVRSLTDTAAGINRVIQSIPPWVRGMLSAAATTAAAAAKSAALALVLGPQAGVQVGARGAAERIANLAREMLGLKTAADGARGALRFGPTLEQLTTGRRDTINLQDPAQIRALRQAELAAARQHAKDLQDVAESERQLSAANAEQDFNEGLIGFAAFFARRTKIVEDGIRATIDALNEERDRLTNAPLPENTKAAQVQRDQEILSISSQIAQVTNDGQRQLLQLVEQERQARLTIQREVAGIQTSVFQATGRDFEAAKVEIEQSAQRFSETLLAQGFGADVVVELRREFVALFTDIASFQQEERVATQELNELSIDRQRIQQAVSEGKLSEREGTLAIAEAERLRIPALREAAKQMLVFAEKVGDPALKLAAQQLTQQIETMGRVTAESARLAANFRNNLLSAAQSEFSTFLGSTITQVDSLGEAFQRLAQSILASFQRIAGDILASQIFERVRGLFGGDSSAGAAALSAAGSSVSAGGVAVTGAATALGTAGGGLVTGAGALTGAAGAMTAAAGAIAAAAAALAAASAAAAASQGASIAFGGLQAAGFARGGAVRGPGTGTSDSVPARLSAGEYVQPARTVAYYGQTFMEAVRRRLVPREWLAGLMERGTSALGFGRGEHREIVSEHSDTSRERVRIGTVETARVATTELVNNLVKIREGLAGDGVQPVRERAETVGGSGAHRDATYYISRLTSSIVESRVRDVSQERSVSRSDRLGFVRHLTSLFRREERREGVEERQNERNLLVPPFLPRRGVAQVIHQSVSAVHSLTRDLPRIVRGERGVREGHEAGKAISVGLVDRVLAVRDIGNKREDRSGGVPAVAGQPWADRGLAHRSLALIRSVVNTVIGREQAADLRGDGAQLAEPRVREVLALEKVGVGVNQSHIVSRQITERLRQLTETVALFRTDRVLKELTTATFADRERESVQHSTDHLRERDRERRFSSHHTLSLGTVQYTVRRVLESIRMLLRPLAFAPLALAAGGVVRGPGTATSDSIPARLSAGEFVQPARTTSYYGVRVMEAIRNRLIPRDALHELVLSTPHLALQTPQVRSLDAAGIPDLRFAEGGVVPAVGAGTASPVTLSRDDTLALEVSHSDDAIVRVLSSSRGVKVLTRLIQANKAQFRAVLS
jgi:hypothetical protein